MQKMIRKHVDSMGPADRRAAIMKWASMPLWVFLAVNILVLAAIQSAPLLKVDVPSWLEETLRVGSVILTGILVFNFFSVIVFFQLQKFARNHMIWKQYQRSVAKASGQRAGNSKASFKR
ncbi:hypothetical protein [Nevskia ramosa]|uniref:hypothetical protein n=1 Tax=Nevskia ramosa TaxID=64002 RepID=UPI002355D2FE|nr:hypothetical protein [Nevskia ramosa]